jgi:glycosidase
MGTSACREKDGRILFADDVMELSFDRETGRWLGMRELAGGSVVLHGGEVQAPVAITVGGTTTSTLGRGHVPSVIDARPAGLDARCTGYECAASKKGPTLVLHRRDGDWLFDENYHLAAGRARMDRSLTIRYEGKGEVLLRGMEVRIPPATLGDVKDCFVEAPSYPTKPHQPLGSLPLGEPWKRVLTPVGHGAPGWNTGFFAMDNPSRPLFLGIWVFDTVESASLNVLPTDVGLRVTHVVDIAARMHKGTVVAWEGQHVSVAHTDWRKGMESFQTWYDDVGWTVPSDVPEWSRTAHIFNHSIGWDGSTVCNYPTHEALLDDLPRIKALGFNVVYQRPHVPHPGYCSEDYHDVASQYGSVEGLHKVVKRAHELGMRVMLDVGIHGVVDQEMADLWKKSFASTYFDDHPLPPVNRYRVEHPEWFMRTEAGPMAATFTWAFDHAHPGMQDFLVQELAYYVREFDVDAFRIDAPTWIPFPNWAEGLPYRGSASIYGSAILFEKARRVIHAFKPDVLFYSECPGPVFLHAFDTVYNYDMQWIYSGLLMPKSEKGYWYLAAFPDERIDASDLGPWLEQQRLSRPRGAWTVQHLDSGDSYGWSNNQFRREVFGERAARALFACNVAIAGAIMMVEGAEVGMEEFYRTILGLKRSLPALDHGSLDHRAVTADDPRVFTLLRKLDGQVIIPVVNIADKISHTTLKVDTAALGLRGGSFRVTDRYDGSVIAGPSGVIWSAAELASIKVPVGAFHFRFLEISPA